MGGISVLWGSRARRWTFRAVFVVSLSVALFAYGIPLWYHLHGQRLLVVTSGSMAPQPGEAPENNQFRTGDAVVIHPVSPSELRVGQVVTYWPIGHEGSLQTHRIIDLVERPDYQNVNGRNVPVLDAEGNPVTTRFIRTQGDFNPQPDMNLTPIANVRGAVATVLPGWGYPLGYAHSAWGRLLVFGPPLVLLLVAELMSWRRRPDPASTNDAPTARERRDAVAAPA